jgi:hypothetical protein
MARWLPLTATRGRSYLTDKPIEQATSTELTGGAGFTYEDTVVAYYAPFVRRAWALTLIMAW